MSDQSPVNRRRFFREGLRELLKPLASAVEPIEEVVRQLEGMDATAVRGGVAPRVPQPPRPPEPVAFLRPPGALAGDDFASACTRCGDCVRACPAHCIQLDETGRVAGGAPYVVPDTMPCVVCDGLQCMHACPSGALRPIPLGEIDMGTAVWNEARCVRSHGEACTTCVDQCPVGSVAIELSGGKVRVIEDGCIGCGVCEHYCPTGPKSITVVPRDARDLPVTRSRW
jgi:ferredoxin-type protein NapG